MHIIGREGEFSLFAEEEEGNAEYGVMVQPSQQYVAPCVKGVEWGLGTRGLRMVAAFLGRCYTGGRCILTPYTIYIFEFSKSLFINFSIYFYSC